MLEERAGETLRKAVAQLEHVREIGLFEALERGEFADVQRDPKGGRGFEGVITKNADYFNPIYAALREGKMSGPPVGPAPGERVMVQAKGAGHAH